MSKKTDPRKKTLELSTLKDLAGGQVEATINAALRAAIADVEDRGSDKKPRKVVIELVFTKLTNSSSAFSVGCKATTKIPAYVTDNTIGHVSFESGAPRLKFSPDSPENPDQQTLPIGNDADDDD